jgi:tetratricopeptide (TPR) repeat protein
MAMRKWIPALLSLALLAGCAANERRLESYKRWYSARAKMLYGVALEHLKVGQLDKARNKAQEALTLDPDFAPGRLLMAKVEIEQGQYGRAAERLEQLRKDWPDSAEVVYLFGVAQEKEGKLEGALESYRQAQALDTENLGGVTAAGEVLVALDRIDEAEKYVAGYLPEADNEPALYELSGRIAVMRGDYATAVARFQRARDADYENPFYQEWLGRAEYLAGQHTEAIATLKELVLCRDYEPPAWIHKTRGDCHMALKQYAQARDAYVAARQKKPESPEAWADIAKAALALQDAPRAILSAREALRLDAGCEEAALILGYALLVDGQTRDAISALDAAVRAHPRNGTLRCLLGRAYEASGDSASAERCYQAAVLVDPSNELARALLAAGHVDEPQRDG